MKNALKLNLRLYGGKDPSELHIKKNFDFEKLLATAKPIDITELEHKWEIPTPMENIKPVIPFPIASFPKTIRDYVEAVAEHTQTPIDMSAVSVMCVVATAIQGKFEIEGKEDYTETSNIYCMVIAQPGERKSAVQKTTTKPLIDFEKEENERRKPIIAKQESELKMIKAQIDKLEKSGKIEDIVKIEDLQSKFQELEKTQIKPLRLTADNCTSEALTSLLADNDGKISVISAEGGIFDILNGQYNSKTTASIDTFLKAHCGDIIRVDRKSRESEYIEKPTMTVLLAVQDTVLEGLISNDIFRGKGLTARFLYCNPTSKLGTRNFKTEKISLIVEEEYKKLIYNLLKLPNTEKPIILKLSTDANKELENFYNWLEPRLVDELDFMADWAGKLVGASLRIAGILHCMEYTNITYGCSVSINTMKKAIDISKYFLEHSKYAYMLMGTDKETQKAKYILKKLKKQEKSLLKRNEIATLCRSKDIKNANDIIKALDILVENGYILELKAEERTGVGRKPDIVYELNPLYFKK